jgi:uncharacterized repeat protein (TIGR01451 family)
MKWALVAALLAACAAGCTSYERKLGSAWGHHIQREHGKPSDWSYYENFDPKAATIEVTPMVSTNPAGTQHVLIATVKDAAGNPLPSRRVEWIIEPGGVGSIVELDESGWLSTRGYKVDNNYGVSHTNRNHHVLTRGNSDRSDDVKLAPGQTWCVITSPVEGDTRVIVYAPGIYNWDNHKVFVVKYWRNPALTVTKSGPATRYIGQEFTHEITVTNTGRGVAKNTVLEDWLPSNAAFVKASDGARRSGGKVLWRLGDLEAGASRTVSITFKGDRIGVVRNAVAAKAWGAEASSDAVTKVVGIPAILLEAVDVDDPVQVGKNVTYVVTVKNQGSAVGTNVKIVCTLPAEEAYVSSTGPTKAAVQGNVVTFAPLAKLPVRGEATYSIVAKAAGAGDVRFAVELTSDQLTTPVRETESTRIYE